VLKAKAVLCPGLEMRLAVEKTGEKESWLYTGGLEQYLRESLESGEWLPEELFTGSVEGEHEGVDWAVAWRIDGGARVEESYVNLIPTLQGGTHVNGFRLGLTEAIREFCEFRNLLPRGLKLAPRTCGTTRATCSRPRCATRSSRGRRRSDSLRVSPRRSSPGSSRTSSGCG